MEVYVSFIRVLLNEDLRHLNSKMKTRVALLCSFCHEILCNAIETIVPKGKSLDSFKRCSLMFGPIFVRSGPTTLDRPCTGASSKLVSYLKGPIGLFHDFFNQFETSFTLWLSFYLFFRQGQFDKLHTT